MSWFSRFHNYINYNFRAIKEILGPATSFHLQQNSFVRDIFGLGAVPLKVEKITKSEKHEMVNYYYVFVLLPSFYICNCNYNCALTSNGHERLNGEALVKETKEMFTNNFPLLHMT